VNDHCLLAYQERLLHGINVHKGHILSYVMC